LPQYFQVKLSNEISFGVLSKRKRPPMWDKLSIDCPTTRLTVTQMRRQSATKEETPRPEACYPRLNKIIHGEAQFFPKPLSDVDKEQLPAARLGRGQI
jgi:hypothetical protein